MKRFFTCILSVCLAVILFYGLAVPSEALVLSRDVKFNMLDLFRKEVMGKYWSLTSRSIIDGSEGAVGPEGRSSLSDYYCGSSADNKDLTAKYGSDYSTVKLGKTHDLLVNFECPEKGMLIVNLDIDFVTIAKIVDGVSVSIEVNGELAWPEEGTPRIVTSVKGFSGFLDLDVKKGDVVSLVLCGLADRSDDELKVNFFMRYASGDNFQSIRPPYRVAVIGDYFSRDNNYVPFLEERMNASTKRFYEFENISPTWGSVIDSDKVAFSSVRDSAGYQMILTKIDDFVPDCILICLGLRDSWLEDFSKEEYVAEYKAIIEEWRKNFKSVDIYIVTSPFVGERYSHYEVNPEVLVNEILPLQRQLAEDMECDLIDLYSYTKDLYTETNRSFPQDNIRLDVAEFLYNALCCDELPGLTKKMATYSVDVKNFSTPEEPIVSTSTKTTSEVPVITDTEDTSNPSDEAPDISTQSGSEDFTASDRVGGTEDSESTLLPTTTEKNPLPTEGFDAGILLGIVGGAVLLVAVIVVFLVKKKK